MAKITLQDLANLDNPNSAVNTINDNMARIEIAIEKTLTRDGTSPNAMADDLDMDDNRIINLPEAVNDTEPMRKGDAQAMIDDAVADVIAASPYSIYDLAFYIEGIMLDAEKLMRFAAPRALTFPVNLAGSVAKARVAATAQTILSVQKNGVEFGTITFAASGTTGTFVSTAASFASGDVLGIVNQPTADGSLQDTAITLSLLQ